MTEVKIDCQRPTEVDAKDAALFRQVVLQAGEVEEATLPALFMRARLVCFARVEQHLAGVGALKRPYPQHAARAFEQAKSTLDPKDFPYELGWFHVLDRFRGHRISSSMVVELVRRADGAGVYATSRINNDRMHAALARGGFVREGTEFPSQRGGIPLCLFVRHNLSKLDVHHGGAL